MYLPLANSNMRFVCNLLKTKFFKFHIICVQCCSWIVIKYQFNTKKKIMIMNSTKSIYVFSLVIIFVIIDVKNLRCPLKE